MPDEKSLLIEAARPELYRENAFRVAELPVDAQAREISKRQTIVQQASHAGLSVPPGAGRALHLEPPPDLDALSGAMQRLGDPERRLVDELFWFWPQIAGESRNDRGLALLKQGNIKGARDLWLSQEWNSSDGSSARHNLAVLAHASVLDWEYVLLSRSLTQQERSERDAYWQDIFKRWRALLDDEAFWSRVTGRIRELDDPRLTTGVARRMRISLPLTLLLISAKIAVRATERKNPAEARRHLAIMQLSGLELGCKSTIDETLGLAVDPVRERIRALGRVAEPKADADPQHADQVTRQFLDNTLPLLTVLDTLLPVGNATRDGMHDEVASRALACLIPFGNKTERWSVVLELMDRIVPIPASGILRTRVQENRQSVQNNMMGEMLLTAFQGTQQSQAQTPASAPASARPALADLGINVCWFCQRNLALGGLSVNMHRQWQSTSVVVSRCSDCEAAHKRANSFMGTGCSTSIIAGIIVGIVASSNNIGGSIWAAIGLGIAALFAILLLCSILCRLVILLPKRARPISAQFKFPGVRSNMREGWLLGEGHK